jgi:hypothetical protein
MTYVQLCFIQRDSSKLRSMWLLVRKNVVFALQSVVVQGHRGQGERQLNFSVKELAC